MPRSCRLLYENGKLVASVMVETKNRKCSSCGRPGAKKQCDYPLNAGGGRTCDRWLCDRCAVVQKRTSRDTVDFCPAHDRLWKRENLRLPEKTP